MIRGELRHDGDRCHCGALLADADHMGRHNVTYRSGECAGMRGVVVVAECSCGRTAVIPWTADVPRAA